MSVVQNCTLLWAIQLKLEKNKDYPSLYFGHPVHDITNRTIFLSFFSQNSAVVSSVVEVGDKTVG